MADIIELPENIIGKEDHSALEAFGGHEIARGRATRYGWSKKGNGDPVFSLYRGGANEELALSVTRNRTEDEFEARGPEGLLISSGSLEHIMAAIDQLLAFDHGESSAS